MITLWRVQKWEAGKWWDLGHAWRSRQEAVDAAHALTLTTADIYRAASITVTIEPA